MVPINQLRPSVEWYPYSANTDVCGGAWALAGRKKSLRMKIRQMGIPLLEEFVVQGRGSFGLDARVRRQERSARAWTEVGGVVRFPCLSSLSAPQPAGTERRTREPESAAWPRTESATSPASNPVSPRNVHHNLQRSNDTIYDIQSHQSGAVQLVNLASAMDGGSQRKPRVA